METFPIRRVTMNNELKASVVMAFIIFTSACTTGWSWQIGTPITTYWAGPGINDISAKQIADGGFNLAWLCPEKDFDTLRQYGLRALLFAPVLRGDALYGNQMNDKAQIAEIDSLIERVKRHPAMGAYHVCDEPIVKDFFALGKLVAHIRERDPAHFSNINLLGIAAMGSNVFVKGPFFYADGTQVNTTGWTTADYYRGYLRLFIEQVKPELLIYDHYNFFSKSGQKNLNSNDSIDSNLYLLNLALVREAALGADIPFMNIVQGCSIAQKGVKTNYRAPNGHEMRWLNYTSLAYGAQGLSYYVYYYPEHYTEALERGVDPGGMMRPDGSTTPQYAAAKELNPQFIAIASELQPLRSLGVYRECKVTPLPEGAVALPKNAPFFLDFSKDATTDPGLLLGYFGKTGKSATPTHALVVNLNYKEAVIATVVGPSQLCLFDAATRQWTSTSNSRVVVTLPPGGGKLIRVQ
jgi:hypothetical protein